MYTLEERVNRLENENKQLRADVDNLKRTVLAMLQTPSAAKRQK